jgi:hypothetical protein
VTTTIVKKKKNDISNQVGLTNFIRRKTSWAGQTKKKKGENDLKNKR